MHYATVYTLFQKCVLQRDAAFIGALLQANEGKDTMDTKGLLQGLYRRQWFAIGAGRTLGPAPISRRRNSAEFRQGIIGELAAWFSPLILCGNYRNSQIHFSESRTYKTFLAYLEDTYTINVYDMQKCLAIVYCYETWKCRKATNIRRTARIGLSLSVHRRPGAILRGSP